MEGLYFSLFYREKMDVMQWSIVGHWLLSDVVAPKGAVFSDLQCNVESEFDEAGRVGS